MLQNNNSGYSPGFFFDFHSRFFYFDEEYQTPRLFIKEKGQRKCYQVFQKSACIIPMMRNLSNLKTAETEEKEALEKWIDVEGGDMKSEMMKEWKKISLHDMEEMEEYRELDHSLTQMEKLVQKRIKQNDPVIDEM